MKVDALYMIREKQTEIRTIEIDPPTAGAIQVEVKACGVCAWDSFLFRGRDLVSPFPFAFGHEAVGYVSAVGPGVTKFKVGDKVFCIENDIMPEMAQVINVSQDRVGLLPDIDEKEFPYYVEEPVACIVSGMDLVPSRPGDSVALIGTGYMGLLNVQGYHSSPLGKLICFDIDEKRLALAKKYGADEVYLSTSEEGQAEIEKLTVNGGMDLVIECSGSQSGLDIAMKLVKQGGTVSNFAWHRGKRIVNGTSWHLKGVAVINTSDGRNLHFSDEIDRTAALVARGVFDQHELVTHILPYKDAQEMMMLADTKQDGYIKGIITF